MNAAALPEGWVVLGAAKIQAETIREQPFPSMALPDLRLPDEIQARIQEDLTRALAARSEKKLEVFLRVLCRCPEKASGIEGVVLAESQHNHSPPPAWNYFIIERGMEDVAGLLIELFLFPDR